MFYDGFTLSRTAAITAFIVFSYSFQYQVSDDFSFSESTLPPLLCPSFSCGSIFCSGYGGVTVWYKDLDNWIEVFLYPNERGIYVFENIDGAGSSGGLFRYRYTSYEYYTWYNLRVDADSINGELAVYINDTYLFTHNTITPYRTGLSGVNCGNGGAYFDNFLITPFPSSVILGSIGLTFTGWLLRKRKML